MFAQLTGTQPMMQLTGALPPENHFSKLVIILKTRSMHVNYSYKICGRND